MNKIFYLC